MNEMNPPSLATWLLEYLAHSPRNDALARSLLEEPRIARLGRILNRRVS
jgi:hypothetical protein